jgi:predicted ATPase/DNA-binding winged helix-turn-helix (wHTH) protein
MADRIYSFGPFQLFPERGSLLEGSKRIRLGTRALEILIALVERAGEVVSNQDLIARVWPETFVEDNNLRVHLALLRKALHDGHDQVRYILNVPGRGYRFAIPVISKRTLFGSGKSNLPGVLTRLIGRDGIVKDLVDQVQGHRLVTLVGSAGIGKTGVALTVAHEIAGDYEDGACFLDLTELNDPKRVVEVLVSALKIPLFSSDPMGSLIDFLSDKRMLIVLDSCEHVVEQAAVLVEAVLRGAPEVQFLATSREPLRAEGEWLKRLPPLDAPPPSDKPITAAQALGFPAVQLFVERAESALDSFALADRDAPLLAEICRELDGLPLAIELAAAVVDTLGVAGLAAQSDDRLSILTQGRRTAQGRHRSLRAALDWSFDRLPEREQILFARLSTFQSDFSQDAAIASASDAVLGAEKVIDGLTSLVAKSLVVNSFHGGSVSYRLFATTRAYASEKLDWSSLGANIQIEQPLRLLHNPRVKSGNFTGALPWATEVLLNGPGADQAAPSYTSISGGNPSRMHCSKR